MLTVCLVLIVFVCFLLILVVMVQNPKGGGLSSSFGGSQQLGGVQKTTDFLDKSTWTLGAILVALILVSGMFFESSAPVATEEDQTEAPAPESNGNDTAPAAKPEAPAGKTETPAPAQ